MMEYEQICFPQWETQAEISRFGNNAGTHSHYEAIIRSTSVNADFATQARNIEKTLEELMKGHDESRVVMKRFFMSDIANQAEVLSSMLPERACPVSIIGQPPVDGTKIALAVCVADNVEVNRISEHMWAFMKDGYRHILSAGKRGETPSREATARLIDEYAGELHAQGCSLADNCMRTWFFVRDIGLHYGGMVAGRNEAFARHGLTRDTHFITSTGIGACQPGMRDVVTMDTYAVEGIKPQQVRYLKGEGFMNRTIEYGVAFERGIAVDYADWCHVMISGTASIDSKGRIMYPGDIVRQTGRMLDNINALLSEAGCDWCDVSHIIVYLRDYADKATVEPILSARIKNIPRIVVHGDVCRPGWLIEAECMAFKSL